MPISIVTLRAMAAAGATAETIIAAIEAEQTQDARAVRRKKDRERKQKSRLSLKSRGQPVTSRDGADATQLIAVPQAAGAIDRAAAAPGNAAAHAQKERSPQTPLKKNTLHTQDPSLSVDRRKEESGDTRARARRKRGELLPADWRPAAGDIAYGCRLGLSDAQIEDAFEGMRLWAQSNAHREVARKTDWSSAFRAWMRGNRGPPGARRHNGHWSNGHAQHRSSGFHSNLIDYADELGLGAEPGRAARDFRSGR